LSLIRALVLFGATACGSASAPPPVTAEHPKAAAVAPVRATQERETVRVAPPPAVKVTQATSRKQVADVMEAHQGAIAGCHTIQFSGKPMQAGSVTLLLSVRKDGSVEQADLGDSSFEQGPFSRCLLDVAKELRFAEADTALEIAWRFKFAAAKPPARGKTAALP
jgi:hypothetical protein